jgi:hypothetical protein
MVLQRPFSLYSLLLILKGEFCEGRCKTLQLLLKQKRAHNLNDDFSLNTLSLSLSRSGTLLFHKIVCYSTSCWTYILLEKRNSACDWMWQSCLGFRSCMGWPGIPASTGWFGYLHNWSKTWFLWRECSNILTYPVRLPLLLKTGSLAKTGHNKAVSLSKACRLCAQFTFPSSSIVNEHFPI